MHAKLLQSCPTLCDPMDCSLPDSSVWDSPGKSTGVGCHDSSLYLGAPIFGFPGGSVGEEFTCSVRDLDSIFGLGGSLGEEKGYQLQYSGLKNSMNYIVHGVAKSRM